MLIYKVRGQISINRIKLEQQLQELDKAEGDFQKEFTHEIPVQRKIKDFRYSFTFRYHKN